MATVMIDMVCMTVASAPGTGTIHLGSSLGIGGVLSMQQAGAVDGGLYYYYIQDGHNREKGFGVYSASAQTWTRNVLSASTNGVSQTTPINLTANAVISGRETPVVGGFVNRFRNGTMDVWQRGTSVTVPTTGAYTADGWIVVPTGASVVASQAAGRGPTVNSLKVAGASGVTDVVVKQRIEGAMATLFVGGSVTVQAQVENNTGATITPTLTVKHANAADNWSAATVDVNAVAFQSCPNGTWTQVSLTFTDAGFAANGLEITFDFGNNFGSGTKSIQLTECDIRFSPSLVAAELRPIANELILCQRYFQSTYGNNVAPGTVTTAGLASAFGNASTIAFSTPMRVAPTLNSWDAAGNANKVSIVNSGVNSDSLIQLIGSVNPFNGVTSAIINNAGAGINIAPGDIVVVIVDYSGSPSSVASISDGSNSYNHIITQNNHEFWYAKNCTAVFNPQITVNLSSQNNIAALALRIPSANSLDKSVAGGGNLSTGTLTTAPEIAVACNFTNSTSFGDSNWDNITAFVEASSPSNTLVVQSRYVTTTASLNFNPTNAFTDFVTTFTLNAAGSFTNNLPGGGILSISEGVNGFLTGLGFNAVLAGAYFHYTASAEL